MWSDSETDYFQRIKWIEKINSIKKTNECSAEINQITHQLKRSESFLSFTLMNECCSNDSIIGLKKRFVMINVNVNK